MSITTKHIWDSSQPIFYIKKHNAELKHRQSQYLAIYNLVRETIKQELIKYREAHNAFWDNTADINATYFNACYKDSGIKNVECKRANNVNDVHASYQKINNEQKIPEMKQSMVRSEELYTTKEFREFMTLFKTLDIKIEQPIIAGTCMKIVDMEVYSKEKELIDGFDLQRLSAKYVITIKLVDGIDIKMNCISEIFDFSHNKPCTLGYLLHGDEKQGDFTDIIMTIPRNNTVDVVQIPCYSLQWFIKDILRISVQSGWSVKYAKRAGRLYKSIIMLLLYPLDNPAQTNQLLDFIQNPGGKPFNNKSLPVLLNDILIILHKNNVIIPQYYRDINTILINMLPNSQGGNVTSQTVSEWVTGNITWIMRIVVTICVLGVLITILYFVFPAIQNVYNKQYTISKITNPPVP